MPHYATLSAPLTWLISHVATLLKPPMGPNDNVPGQVALGLPWVRHTLPLDFMATDHAIRRLMLVPGSPLAVWGRQMGIPGEYMEWLTGEDAANVVFLNVWKLRMICEGRGY